MSSSTAFLDKHKIHVVRGNSGAYTKYLCDYLVEILNRNHKASEGVITIGVSGGSMPKQIWSCLNRSFGDGPFRDRVVFFPVDERLVPVDHLDSNVGAYLNLLPAQFASKFIQVQHIADASKAATTFEEALRKTGVKLTDDGFPQFDILFLGLGPDGHTCSLFPGHHLLYEDSKWVAPIEDSPKMPPRRVTITLPVIRNAKHVAFLATGEGKAQVLKEILVDGNGNYPPVLIKPKGDLVVDWILDEAAAGKLQG